MEALALRSERILPVVRGLCDEPVTCDMVCEGVRGKDPGVRGKRLGVPRDQRRLRASSSPAGRLLIGVLIVSDEANTSEAS